MSANEDPAARDGGGPAAWTFPDMAPLLMPQVAVDAGIYVSGVAEIFELGSLDDDAVAKEKSVRRSIPVSKDNALLDPATFSEQVALSGLSVPPHLLDVAWDLAWDCNLRSVADARRSLYPQRVRLLLSTLRSVLPTTDQKEQEYAALIAIILYSDDLSPADLAICAREIADDVTRGPLARYMSPVPVGATRDDELRPPATTSEERSTPRRRGGRSR
ncbi:hypothetical protein [Pimelobacter simplex]|uniref:hypothetical protein n=1 Tax=Nocardioides simplex TaxID=2045 RepID=UPI002150001C|nr:hypothetical protein [Pimelobacter simplex]UUW90435.1 hypothetical protein M0M43_02790 [Pimelobacter simplex]UUW94265.1 hypothetical protein M0M48_21305 [Pimelobacter simplex]